MWLEVEKAILDRLNPLSLLTSTQLSLSRSKSIFKNTKLALLRIDKKLELSIKGSKMESLWFNHRIVYKGKSLNFDTWINKGIFFPYQLEHDLYPVTFSDLQTRYNLDNIEFYNFFKVRAALTKAKLFNIQPSLPMFVTKINKLGHQFPIYINFFTPKLLNSIIILSLSGICIPLIHYLNPYGRRCGVQYRVTKYLQYFPKVLAFAQGLLDACSFTLLRYSR